MEVARWLILQGAANDGSGHVNPENLRGDILERFWQQGDMSTLLASLEFLQMQHAAFVRVLATVRAGPPPRSSGDGAAPTCGEKRSRALRGSPLSLLVGHESTLLVLVADYIGVTRGRELRNLREATRVLADPEASYEASRC